MLHCESPSPLKSFTLRSVRSFADGLATQVSKRRLQNMCKLHVAVLVATIFQKTFVSNDGHGMNQDDFIPRHLRSPFQLAFVPSVNGKYDTNSIHNQNTLSKSAECFITTNCIKGIGPNVPSWLAKGSAVCYHLVLNGIFHIFNPGRKSLWFYALLNKAIWR